MAKKERVLQQHDSAERQASPAREISAQSNRQQPHYDGNSSPNLDGTIQFSGTTIGPFLGEWQGLPRNQIIAERLNNITEADLKNTRVEPTSGGVRVFFGDISITLLSADIAAMNIEKNPSVSTERAAALQLIQQLGGEPPRQTMAEVRGELALRQAKLTYTQGREKVGSGSWETRGSNSGALLDEINAANHAGSGYEWCGMYVGHAYKKAGIRPEILRSLVFWSGYRLYLFFTRGVDVSNHPVGSFWQPHKYQDIPLRGGENRRRALEAFDPKRGD